MSRRVDKDRVVRVGQQYRDIEARRGNRIVEVLDIIDGAGNQIPTGTATLREHPDGRVQVDVVYHDNEDSVGGRRWMRLEWLVVIPTSRGFIPIDEGKTA